MRSDSLVRGACALLFVLALSSPALLVTWEWWREIFIGLIVLVVIMMAVTVACFTRMNDQVQE